MSVTWFGATVDISQVEVNGRIYDRRETTKAEFNLCNANARVLLDLLGLDITEELCGECPVPEVRRAIIRAHATIDNRLHELVRPNEVVYGPPSTDEDGVVELHPVRCFGQGLSEDGIRDRLSRFESFFFDACREGAVSIVWS